MNDCERIQARIAQERPSAADLRHLADCADCRRLQALCRRMAAPPSVPPAPPAQVDAAVLQAAREALARRQAGRMRPALFLHSRPVLRLALGLAAAVALVLAVNWPGMTGRGGGGPAPAPRVTWADASLDEALLFLEAAMGNAGDSGPAAVRGGSPIEEALFESDVQLLLQEQLLAMESPGA